MKQSNICMITNIGPHYRYPIFNLLGEALNTDFYIGDRLQFEIKTFDYHALTGYKKTLHNVFINKFIGKKALSAHYSDTTNISFLMVSLSAFRPGSSFCLLG